MDVRQIVMVSQLRDPIINDLCNLFKFEVSFNDPGVSHFGLENAVIPIGTDFLEVVSPVEENTTAGRFLDKRNGDGGYMVIIQVDDFDVSKRLVHENDIDIVWETDLPEARAIHLHPKEMGGAILSLDWMNPRDSWKWAGPNWKNHISGYVKAVDGVEIQSSNPNEMYHKWQKVLGVKDSQPKENLINLDNTWIKFVKDEDGRGAGVSAFSLKVDDSIHIKNKAEKLGYVIDGDLIIGGVKFYLV